MTSDIYSDYQWQTNSMQLRKDCIWLPFYPIHCPYNLCKYLFSFPRPPSISSFPLPLPLPLQNDKLARSRNHHPSVRHLQQCHPFRIRSIRVSILFILSLPFNKACPAGNLSSISPLNGLSSPRNATFAGPWSAPLHPNSSLLTRPRFSTLPAAISCSSPSLASSSLSMSQIK